MASISIVSVTIIIFRTILFTIFSSVILAIVNSIRSRKFTLLPFKNWSVKKFLAALFIIPICLSLLSFIWLTIGSKRDLASLIESLRTCSHLEIDNSYSDKEAWSYLIEKKTIDDRKTIEILADVVCRGNYGRMIENVAIGTKDVVAVSIYKNESQIKNFSVIGGNIFITNNHMYECNDKNLLRKARKILEVSDE